MFREPGPPSATSEADETKAGEADGSGFSLLARVHVAFPGFSGQETRVDETGGDHILLIVDEQYAFRFPRAGMHSLDLELEMLKHLQARTTLRTPVYDYVDPHGRFAGYRLIEGSPLTGERFRHMPAMTQQALIDDVASFLTVLHAMAPSATAPLSHWPRAWGAVEYADRITERLPLIGARYPALAASIADFINAYRLDRPLAMVVVHGDLVTDHILVEDGAEHLAGIIDFGDVALGDPALDLAGCWAYGHGPMVRLIERYGSADGDLFNRSRNHFIRRQIDLLFEQLSEGRASDIIEQTGPELTALLGR